MTVTLRPASGNRHVTIPRLRAIASGLTRSFSEVVRPAVVLALCLCSAAFAGYDPFRHAETASWVMVGWSSACAAASVRLLGNENKVVRMAGRQALMWGVIDAGLAGVDLWRNSSASESGMSSAERTREYRAEIRVDWLVDFALLTSGVVILQHATTDKGRVRGWRWVIRGAVHLAFDMVNYGLTYR